MSDKSSIEDARRSHRVAEAARLAAKAFAVKDWTWTAKGGEEVEAFQPDALDLYASLENKVRHLFDNPDVTEVRSGRLTVQRREDEEGDTEEIVLYLELGFIPVKYPDWDYD